MRYKFLALVYIVVCFCYCKWRVTRTRIPWIQVLVTRIWFSAPHELNVRQGVHLAHGTLKFSQIDIDFLSIVRHALWGKGSLQLAHSNHQPLCCITSNNLFLSRWVANVESYPSLFCLKVAEVFLVFSVIYLVQHVWHIYRFTDLTIAFYSLSLHSIKLLSLFILKVASLKCPLHAVLAIDV